MAPFNTFFGILILAIPLAVAIPRYTEVTEHQAISFQGTPLEARWGLIIPLSLTSVDFIPVPMTLTVAPPRGHTAAGGTAVRHGNGAGLSRTSTVRGIINATLQHVAPARVAGA